MRRIARPTTAPEHPERFTDCQRAIEDRVLELCGDAVMSGWEEAEVLEAIVAVADYTQMAIRGEARMLTGPQFINRLRHMLKKRSS